MPGEEDAAAALRGEPKESLFSPGET